MNEVELYSEFRQLIGNPSVDAVAKRQLQSPLQFALDWLASKLKYNIKTDSKFCTLVAEQQEYLLPGDCAWIDWLEWNDIKLTPMSTDLWDTDKTKWRSEDSGLPREFAVQGRNLILRPNPSATAVSTSNSLTLRYIAAADRMERGEFGQLGKMDQHLIALVAAIRWHRTHPTDTSETTLQELKEERDELLRDAADRALNPITDYNPTLRVFTMRRGAAR